MTGRLIAVVGPSGVGKDTVMEALRSARPDIALVRRVITRPSEAGGEDFDGVTEEAFKAQQVAGAFVLSWQAHGLSYGIPKSIRHRLDAGEDMLINLSRAVLAEAQDAFPSLQVINLTASKEVLAKRLAARGRETAEDISRRLDRKGAALPPTCNVLEIDNSGALDATLEKILNALYPVSA